jgi:hypothetical protein
MHGAIMAVMLAQAIGLLLFVRERHSALADAGMFIFALALAGGLGAGTINGFVVSALMQNLPVADHRPIYQLLWAANQALAVGGVLLTSLAYAFWAANLWHSRWRGTAAAALAASLVPAIALLGGFVTMDISGALFCYAVQAAWAAWLGLALIRARA